MQIAVLMLLMFGAAKSIYYYEPLIEHHPKVNIRGKKGFMSFESFYNHQHLNLLNQTKFEDLEGAFDKEIKKKWAWRNHGKAVKRTGGRRGKGRWGSRKHSHHDLFGGNWKYSH